MEDGRIRYCRNCNQRYAHNVFTCPRCNMPTALLYTRGKKKSHTGHIIGIVCIIVIIFIALVWLNDDTVSLTNFDSTQSRIIPREISKTEYIAQCSEVEYKTIARNPDNYKGDYIKFTARVGQVLEGNRTINLLVYQENEDMFSSDSWLVLYIPSKNENRILEDDIITVYGVCNGLITYKSILNQQISVPSVEMKYYDLISD